MNKEIRQLICMIEVASDDIVKELEINETSVEALRRIKSSVSRMQSAVNGYSSDVQAACEPVLQHVLTYVRMASRYGEAIEDYADRIVDHVDSYLLLQRPYDTEREQRLDREMETAVELKRSELKLERIAKDMRALIDQKLNGEFPVGSPRYKNIVTKYNDLQLQFNSENDRLEHLQNVAKQNGLIRQAAEKKMTYAEISSLRTMSLEEFAQITGENKERALEEKALMQAFEQVAFEDASEAFDFSDFAFQKALEDTLLERLAKNQAESYEDQITQMPKGELLEAIVQLNQKMDAMQTQISASQGQQKENARELREQLVELYAKTQDAAALRKDVMVDDIVKEVDYCLARTPMDIQSAHLKLRSCIELYCRYVCGIDLNDKLFFKPDEERGNKFMATGMPREKCEELVSIYGDANGFVHGGIDVLGKNDEQQAKILRENAQKLKLWGIDKYTLAQGLPLFYSKQNAQLLERLKDGSFDSAFVQSDPNRKLHYYFKRMDYMRSYMEKNGIAVPKVDFTSTADILRYLGDAVAMPAVTAAPQTEEKPNVGSTLEGIVTWYDEQRRIGKINRTIHFHRSEVRDLSALADGVRVSYTMGEHNGNPCAKNIRVISAPELA
jgi:cold shock CspA family protein